MEDTTDESFRECSCNGYSVIKLQQQQLKNKDAEIAKLTNLLEVQDKLHSHNNHKAYKFNKLEAVISACGGWANFHHYITKRMYDEIKLFEATQSQNKIYKEALEKIVHNCIFGKGVAQQALEQAKAIQ